jgi:phosphopantetheinyl transferase
MARREMFYRLWTGKEACVKALGGRMSNLGFKRIDFSRAAQVRPYPKIWRGLYVRWFTPTPGSVAAVACDSLPMNVRLLRWADLQSKA